MGRVDLGRVVLVPTWPEFSLSGAVQVVDRFLSWTDCPASTGITKVNFETTPSNHATVEMRSLLMASLPSVLFFLITSADELACR